MRDRDQACAALRAAVQPGAAARLLHDAIALVERALRERPYPPEIFDAVRECLASLPSGHRAKAKLERMLWHERPSPACITNRIHGGIQALERDEALGWQWLLRHSAPSTTVAPGKAWITEACRRLDAIGEDVFIARLDAWLQFDEPTRLSKTGSDFLRLLVWYAWLVDRDQAVRILGRLAGLQWSNRKPAEKIISALANLLSSQPSPSYRQIALRLFEQWPDNQEVQRLERAYDPTKRKAPNRAELDGLNQLFARYLA